MQRNMELGQYNLFCFIQPECPSEPCRQLRVYSRNKGGRE